MDRTGDVIELLVEHATDFRMCDLLDDSGPPGSGGNSYNSGPRKSGDGAVGLGLVPGKHKTIQNVLLFLYLKLYRMIDNAIYIVYLIYRLYHV